MNISSVASAASGGGRGVSERPVAPAATKMAVETVTQTQSPERAQSPERVVQAVKHVNDDFVRKGQSIVAAHEIDKATGIGVVKIMDRNTREVVGQFPSKAILAIAESIDSYQKSNGILLHVSA